MRITNLKIRFKMLLLVSAGCAGILIVGTVGLMGLKTTTTLMVGLISICLGGVVSAGLYLTASIIAPLGAVLNTLHSIAAGDLTARCKDYGSDETGMLARAVNTTGEKLHEAINLLALTVGQFTTTSSRLHAIAEHMATASEEVAAQASTVATSSEEMAATSSEIAQSCTIAAHGAEEANNSALEGSGVVQDTVFGMGDISDMVKETANTITGLGSRSDQIGEIVGTIEDIADQTNLLALNAAIEAARAGEQGRGFAVVADEVRALAERTTKATREISEMIKAIQSETKKAVYAMEKSVEKVEYGTECAAKSGGALSDIIDQNNAVSTQVSQIATAAEQQTATTGEISNNIQQISQVIQETAKGAQDSAEAAGMLESLAGDLQQLVAQFKLAS